MKVMNIIFYYRKKQGGNCSKTTRKYWQNKSKSSKAWVSYVTPPNRIKALYMKPRPNILG
jgi:hypothetical protein